MDHSVMEGKTFNQEALSFKELSYNRPLVHTTHTLVDASLNLICRVWEFSKVLYLA